MKNSKSNVCLKITVCCPHSCVDVWMRGREADHIFADIGNLLDSSERGLCKECEKTKQNRDATSHMLSKRSKSSEVGVSVRSSPPLND